MLVSLFSPYEALLRHADDVVMSSTDLIIVLKDGKVAEQGTHVELMANNGVYADLWVAQSHERAVDAVRDEHVDEVLIEEDKPKNA